MCALFVIIVISISWRSRHLLSNFVKQRWAVSIDTDWHVNVLFCPQVLAGMEGSCRFKIVHFFPFHCVLWMHPLLDHLPSVRQKLSNMTVSSIIPRSTMDCHKTSALQNFPFPSNLFLLHKLRKALISFLSSSLSYIVTVPFIHVMFNFVRDTLFPSTLPEMFSYSTFFLGGIF